LRSAAGKNSWVRGFNLSDKPETAGCNPRYNLVETAGSGIPRIPEQGGREELIEMKIARLAGFSLVVFAVLILPLAAQADKGLNIIQFPETRTVKVAFVSSGQIPEARVQAEVKFQEGQFRIEVKFANMKPAVLFGGEVTCYVLWAVNRDGAAENLGELWVRPDAENDTVQFSTGLRNFALLVTGEKYYQVPRPSEMVLFWNANHPDPPVATDQLIFRQFLPAPASGVTSLETVRYDGKKPLDLLQAEKVFQLARELGAEELAPDLFAKASLTLLQATQIYERSQGRGAQRFARDSVAASNEAIRLATRKLELKALEEEYAERQAQMKELEGRVSQSEARVREAEARITEVERHRAEAERNVETARQELEKLNAESIRLTREKSELERSLAALNVERGRLEKEKVTLQTDKQNLQEEKSDLQGRLQQALSQVADTRSSVRGMILNLPDILFSIGKADLKPETELVLAKLAGILLIMPDLNLRIEGHTDSTGAPSFNLRLSEQRADAVFDFLAGQGISSTRMKTAGYGMDRPIADNSIPEGRSRNRRVEIIIAEGEIAVE